jgi:hypothetical protein
VSTATLLTYPSDPRAQSWWAFDHAQNHKPWVGVWQTERLGYSTIPYRIGNFWKDSDNPSWRLNHWQAHCDTVSRQSRPMGPFTAPIGQDLLHSGPTDPVNGKSWVFANHVEHKLVEDNQATNGWPFFYPFG